MSLGWLVVIALTCVACQNSKSTDAPSSSDALDQSIDAGSGSARAEAADVAVTAPDQLVATADGFVAAVRRGQDLELILVEQGAEGPEVTVLASLREPQIPGDASSHTEHFVACPASLELANRYYVFGQNQTGQTLAFEGAPSLGGTVREGTYAIAIGETEMPPAVWRIKTSFGNEISSGSGQVFSATVMDEESACAAG